MSKSKYTLYDLNGKLLDFNTDDEILNYLNEHNIDFEIVDCSFGKYISISRTDYFVMPDLLYFLQGEPHGKE